MLPSCSPWLSVSLGPLHHESFTNRYLCGFAQKLTIFAIKVNGDVSSFSKDRHKDVGQKYSDSTASER